MNEPLDERRILPVRPERVVHRGRVTETGRPRLVDSGPAAPRAPLAPVVPGPRACDLNKCPSPGHATIDLDIGNYTGDHRDRITLVLCAAHTQQYSDGGIVGFAWTPVFRHEVPAHLAPPPVVPDLPEASPPTEGDPPDGIPA